MDALCNTEKIAYIAKSLYHYRYVEGSTSHRWIKNTIECREMIWNHQLNFLKSFEEDIDKLREDGIKRFREVTQKVTSKAHMVANDISVNIGDIVSGRECITGIKVRVPVVRKIYKRTGTKETYDYKLQGE